MSIDGSLNNKGEYRKIIHFDFVYSSACPCSFELAEYARKQRNIPTVTHSQRSVARISLELEEFIWIEDIQEICNKAQTETQVIVKREDEMAFAELNGSYLNLLKMLQDYCMSN